MNRRLEETAQFALDSRGLQAGNPAATCQAPGGVDDTAVNSSFYAQGLPRWGVASDEAGGIS